MRAIWTGEIAFGLVTVPTKLYSGTRDLTPKFHLIHKACGTRVQIVRRCPKCEKDLAWDEVDKAYEVSKGEYARFTKEELAEAEKDEAAGRIEIVEFIEPDEVDLAYIEKSYWVGPGGKSAHSFTLLRTVLEKTGYVALSKVAIRTRTRLALLRPREQLFSLDMMRFADELVGAKDIEVPSSRAPTDKELKLAQTLVAQLTAKFDPSKHPDEYRARVEAVVDEKVEKHETEAGEVSAPHVGKRGAEPIDLSELLMRSLKAKGKPAKTAGRAAVASAAHNQASKRRATHRAG